MEKFLVLNGYEIRPSVDEQERVILQVAAGDGSRSVHRVATKACCPQRRLKVLICRLTPRCSRSAFAGAARTAALFC